MPKHGKKYNAIKEKIQKREYELVEAITLLKDNLVSKFDNTVEVHMKLGVDPKHADQVVRGNVVLPHGTGKKVKVVVITKGEKVQEAEQAGAEFVGAEEIVEKIQGGWMDFDKVIASPDMMPALGKIARVLGPRGLMPNPKSGTVTTNIGAAVKELKAGKVSYRVDKGSNIHAAVGKMSFTKDQIKENILSLVDSIVRAKPAGAKGEYIKTIHIAATMSPSVQLSKAITR